MQIKILKDVRLEVCNHDWPSNKDTIYERLFRKGEVYLIGEVSNLDDDYDVMEFERLGHVEIPRDVWSLDHERIAFVYLDRISLN